VKKIVSLVAVAAVAALVAAAFAAAGGNADVTVGAKLTAKQEIPAQAVKDAKAAGSFTGSIAGSKLTYSLTYSLTFSGLTGPATAAHIHLGAMGKSGNVVVPICGPCKSPVKGSATLSKALLADLKTHKLYVNVHTAKNPAGEIRGQLAEH